MEGEPMADQIDLSKLGVEELQQIRNDVLRTLAQRQQGLGAADPIGPHDKHTSTHSKNTKELTELQGQVVQPGELAKRLGEEHQ